MIGIILEICVIVGSVLTVGTRTRTGIGSCLCLLCVQLFGDLVECLFNRLGIRLDCLGIAALNGFLQLFDRALNLFRVCGISLITKLSMIPAAIAMLLVIPGETGNHPFDAAEAETEICEGLLAEYSGAPLAVYKLTHAIKMLTLTSLFVALFLGGVGVGIPLVDAIIMFALCLVITVISISVVHAVTARLRIEQIFKFYWTTVSGLALVSLVLAWYGL